MDEFPYSPITDDPATKDGPKAIYYGMWHGQVIDNNDPDIRLRCKVRVRPLYLKIADEDLPWAMPGMIWGGASDSIDGSPPPVGAEVWVCFQQGDPDFPVYFGSQFGRPGGTPDIPEEARAGYPDNKVIKTPGGILIEYDDTEGARRVRVKHPSGTEWLMTEEGDMEFTVQGNLKMTVQGDVEETILGNRKVTTTGTDERESTTQIKNTAPIINDN